MAKSDFGEFAEDGSILKDVQHSAVSKRVIQPGDALKRVAGTSFFYRLTAEEHRTLTPEKRAEIEAQVKPADPVKSGKTVEKEKTP